ncbi:MULTISPECIES: GTP pyrophosphokinase family protein [unclassified Rhodococcus (in: high G+C Gram-positive bacteria)]|uniref:GTP pyrophosphokinase n=1 Tax=unclassified Rhodococcus (in: high G+C Gram-positive bacteria) TaxID=192944 RepID=UPI001142430A|nr:MULTISPECIES: hypothetical protein [unclassified Rhodococcus (in: high G+C Gram-positive bacteria)]TQC35951.1 hypothetical protein EEB16_20525 [Rhodococcus sp. WS7]
MGVIEDFVGEYERQFDFWEASARTARSLLEAELGSSGLRAIVTSRAKSVDRLLDKLRQRNLDNSYDSAADIQKDIVDLAGVRVALYFPGQMDEAEQIIRSVLDVHHAKAFPSKHASTGNPIGITPSATSGGAALPLASTPVRPPRFSGYGARHFRVHIPSSRLSAEQQRYASALIEVQVASVLMHAWSEVEHDLVYKPLEGELSTSEYGLLDQLNGLVLAGEIALEQLQMAGDQRVAGARTPFRDHYELAEFLRTRLAASGIDPTDATLGRVDVLFTFLADQKSATAGSIKPYLDLLEQDFERRPVADQLADLMLSGDASRYRAYSRAMLGSRHASNFRGTTLSDVKENSPETLALGRFVTAWVVLESLLNDLDESDGRKPQPLPGLIRRLVETKLVSEEQSEELQMLREMRNRVLHGRGGDVPTQRLTEAASRLGDLTRSIELGVKNRRQRRP